MSMASDVENPSALFTPTNRVELFDLPKTEQEKEHVCLHLRETNVENLATEPVQDCSKRTKDRGKETLSRTQNFLLCSKEKGC